MDRFLWFVPDLMGQDDFSKNNSRIYHFDANWKCISTIRSGVLGCAQVAVDPFRNLLYYSETFPGKITRLNFTTRSLTKKVHGFNRGMILQSTAQERTSVSQPVLLERSITSLLRVNSRGFCKYNSTGFERIMGPAYGIGPISWSQKFESIPDTPGDGACIVQYDPNGTQAKRLTPVVNVNPIIETSDRLLLLGLEYSIYRINEGSFDEYLSDLPYTCGALVLDSDEHIYASLTNDSVLTSSHAKAWEVPTPTLWME